ncbi:MAG: hypothetical protein AMJ94_00740 [Deltaproteobacteria bacterium SM23_61]|nr:MAG: hypothetical protein AMJ94_00740 [Deltaproteobacteria bacterium SM23_61]
MSFFISFSPPVLFIAQIDNPKAMIEIIRVIHSILLTSFFWILRKTKIFGETSPDVPGIISYG